MGENKNKVKSITPRTSQQVTRAAEDLLEQHGSKIPVHIMTIAKALGITVHLEDLEEEVSGMLIVQKGSHAIAVNTNHPEFRRRFTIAHEIGHFVLHRDQNSFFIDGSQSFHRNTKSTNLNERQEREANIFAAQLLMPEPALREYIERKALDPNDEAALNRMAKYFRVSPQALAIQLGKLKLV